MRTNGYRSGRVGVLATLVLLLSIVLFVGCLFWLTVNGPWGGGSLFGDDLFKPASMSTAPPEEISLNASAETVWNITKAIEDLEANGCVFTEYSEEYSGDQTEKLDYAEFRAKAIDRKIVFTAETPESPILLVNVNGNLYEWRP
ncbi:MAG: hypothetical protein NWF07_03815 [Candidatus Bathyarchaeota archaeon]|nr:hypothetical protein [Candidatus Bathyarchaeota archaeon]